MDWRAFEYPGVDDVELVSDELVLENIRLRRNALLRATDWTQLADAPVDSTAWETYRSALRALPTSAAPRNIVFPEPPT